MVFSDEDKILIKKIICNHYGERLAILTSENIKMCR